MTMGSNLTAYNQTSRVIYQALSSSSSVLSPPMVKYSIALMTPLSSPEEKVTLLAQTSEDYLLLAENQAFHHQLEMDESQYFRFDLHSDRYSPTYTN